MQDETPLTPAQKVFEETLRSTTPSAARLDPLAAAFAAGRKSGQHQVQLWRSTTAVAILLGVGALFLPAGHPHTNPPAEFRGPVVAASYEPAPVSDQSLIALQEAVRERGLDGLPTVRTPAVRPPRAKDFF